LEKVSLQIIRKLSNVILDLLMLTQILTMKDARVLIREFFENNKKLSEKYTATDILNL